MPGGGGTQTTTETKAVDPKVAAQQGKIIDLGNQITSPFMQTPAFGVAGLNPDQDAAINGTRDLFTEIQNYRGPTGQAGLGNASAAQLDPNAIAKFQNPFTDQVIDTSLNNMRRNYDQTDANLGARLAAAGAYGGSREAVARSLNARNFGDQASSTNAQLRSQGFDKASALASQDAQMRQQANLANASAANATANNNASREMQGYNDWFGHAMQSIGGLQGVGTLQQQLAQAGINVPFDTLQKLVASTPGFNNVGGTSTTQQPLQDNSLSSILGIGMLGAKLFGLSDDDEKTNKQKVGEDPKTGTPIYAYDYKADVQAARKSGNPMPPKRVGPMASDLQKIDPDGVKTVGGKKIVAMPLIEMIMKGAA